MEEIIAKLAVYIANEVLRQPKRIISPDEALISSGLVDFFSLMDLGLFVEDKFGVRIEDTELNAETFDTLTATCQTCSGAPVTYGSFFYAFSFSIFTCFLINISGQYPTTKTAHRFSGKCYLSYLGRKDSSVVAGRYINFRVFDWACHRQVQKKKVIIPQNGFGLELE